MVRRRKSKNDITKDAIIGIVVLVLLFLVINVAPTGEFYKIENRGDEFPPGSGWLLQDEESGELNCYTHESNFEESCIVKELDEIDMPHDPCSCFSEGMPEEREEDFREEGILEGEEFFEELEMAGLY